MHFLAFLLPSTATTANLSGSLYQWELVCQSMASRLTVTKRGFLAIRCALWRRTWEMTMEVGEALDWLALAKTLSHFALAKRFASASAASSCHQKLQKDRVCRSTSCRGMLKVKEKVMFASSTVSIDDDDAKNGCWWIVHERPTSLASISPFSFVDFSPFSNFSSHLHSHLQSFFSAFIYCFTHCPVETIKKRKVAVTETVTQSSRCS